MVISSAYAPLFCVRLLKTTAALQTVLAALYECMVKLRINFDRTYSLIKQAAKQGLGRPYCVGCDALLPGSLHYCVVRTDLCSGRPATHW
jgi:hypothetical protein